MSVTDSCVAETARLYKDVYVRDSTIGENAIISDRSVLISSTVDQKVEIGRDCSVVHTHFGRGSYVGRGSMVKFTDIGKYCNLSWHLSVGGSNHNYRAACLYTDSWWKKMFDVGEGLGSVPEDERTVIGNDVWIGAKASILRGVKVGDGAVIGASSLVLNDIPPYAIAVGCPARVIKYRFDDETIARLMSIQWWDWNTEVIRSAADYLRGDLNEEKLRKLEEYARGRFAI